MNILLVVSNCGIGGVEKLALSLGRALRAEHRVEIAVLDATGPLVEAYQETFDKVHATWPVYIRQRQSGATPDYHELPSLLRNQIDRADVVHLFNHFAAGAVLAAYCPGKFVQSVHFHPDAMPDRWKAYLSAQQRKIRGVIVDSRLHGHYLDAATFIPNFVDTDYWQPAEGARCGALWVGKFTSAKNPDLLLEIAAQVPVTVVNGVPNLPRSAEYTARLNSLGATVITAASAADMLQLYQSHSHLLITSRHEGTPISLLEGMATGLVPVSTRVGEVPNVIRHGHDGWLYETADEAVASLSQPTDEMATNAQQTASARFEQAQAVARYLGVYNAE